MLFFRTHEENISCDILLVRENVFSAINGQFTLFQLLTQMLTF